MYNSTRTHPVLPPFGVFKVSELSSGPSPNHYMVQSVEQHHTSVFHPSAVGMSISHATQQPMQQVNNGGYDYPASRMPLHPQRSSHDVRERDVYDTVSDRRVIYPEDENELIYQAARILISLSSS